MANDAPVQGANPPVEGAPPFDPSQNVLNLVEAGMKRQDDLRKQDQDHAREMRDTARMYESRLDAKDQLIRESESERIDAIRLVDVQAGQRAAEVQAQAANTLAAQVATTAEAMRNQVAAAATATATALSTALAPMLTRLDELSRAQYETQGQKQQVVETRDVGSDTRSMQAEIQAKAMQARATLMAIIATAGMLLTLISVIAFVLKK
jgi:hypothetical protein